MNKNWITLKCFVSHTEQIEHEREYANGEVFCLLIHQGWRPNHP